MKFIADFHIHSPYSSATSKNLSPKNLDYWAGIKGIKVVGTGDFTHPGWLQELKEKLIPAEEGLFKLKEKKKGQFSVRFILTCEISSIYKKKGKVRKIHNLIFAPDFETAEKIQKKLSKIGNITADGRPILGLDSKNLLEICLECSDKILFVPAHIWTPWFSLLGANSGFDSVEECFEDLSKYIFAVETGLSSDPPMNWMCSFLDKYTLISNSDAHSPEKIGREANLFDTELCYSAIIKAIKEKKGFLGTVEFFPQEGKYHYDGHRKCGIRWSPAETLKHRGICPVCGKKVTIGVMNRVIQLADRPDIKNMKKPQSFYSLIPLKEILSEILEVSPNSKQVTQMYNHLIHKAGSEFALLLDLPVEEIKKIGTEILAEAIRRMRKGEVYIKEGFDGEYGQIKVFAEDEVKASSNFLFSDFPTARKTKKTLRKSMDFALLQNQELPRRKDESEKTFHKDSFLEELNPEQKKAVEHFKGPIIIIAGPGTGKTRVLVLRIANLIKEKKINPESIVALTFTNKAADEMKERLKFLLNDEFIVSKLLVSTFHAFGFEILKQHYETVGRKKNFSIIDEEDKCEILQHEVGCERKNLSKIFNGIIYIKQNLKSAEEIDDPNLAKIFVKYEEVLKKLNAFDLDDLIYQPVKMFIRNPQILATYRERFKWILIDEYQDINFAQYQMIKMLAHEENSNLCVIGDPDQAIYGWRGADVKFIREFVRDFPSASIYRLKKSYRCCDNILRASEGVIGVKKGFLEGLQKGVKIKIIENSTDRSEAEFIARTIEKMMGGLRFFSIDSAITQGNEIPEVKSLSEFAVLCRIKSQMNAIEKAFNDHSIPYQKIDIYPFFRQEPVKSVIDVLKFLRNPENKFLKKRLDEKKIFLGIFKNPENKTVKEKISLIIERFFPENRNDECMKDLVELAQDFGDNFDEFLKFVSLGSGLDTYRPDVERVALMTLHSAKGLEFECVFISGCEDGLLPYSLFDGQISDRDEERRLLYVGMTRAKSFLFLTHAKRRFIFGKQLHLKPSPFLESIKKELIEFSSANKQRKKKEDPQLRLL